jgi:hypothetical protein
MFFDAAVCQAASSAIGQHWTQRQREQASFKAADGGLGILSVAEVLDAAYVGSRAATHELCVAIRPAQRWEHAEDTTPLSAAVANLQQAIPDLAAVAGEAKQLKQGRLSGKVRDNLVKSWRETADAQERVRLNAYSAKGAGALYGLTPSVTLDTNLSAGEFATNVACRLGVDVMDAGRPCQMCGAILDSQGIHCQSCMAGGDAVLEHNAVRDVLFDYCERKGLRPTLEATGLLKARRRAPHGNGQLMFWLFRT